MVSRKYERRVNKTTQQNPTFFNITSYFINHIFMIMGNPRDISGS
jgi:hypothetical protein